MTPITIFACDSQPIVLEGLQRVLEPVTEVQIVGSGTSVLDVLPEIRRLEPQIVLLDQPGGLKMLFRFLSDIKAAVPRTYPILWVSELAEVECFRALQLGARGILKKTLPVTAILDCIRGVAKGQIWMEPTAPSQSGFQNRRQAPRLTPREMEIVRCLCRGLRNKEIAQELSITAGTVKVHLMHIFEKTGVKDRFELAVQGRKLLGIGAEESASVDLQVESVPPAAKTAGEGRD